MDVLNKTTRKRALAVVVAAVVVIVLVSAAILIGRFGMTVQAATYIVVVALLGFSALSDVRRRTVPNVVVIALIALWVASVWFIPCGNAPGDPGAAFSRVVGGGTTAVALDGLVGGLAIGFGMLALVLIVEARTGRHSFGGGDIKLLFATGLYLGLPGSLTMLLMACIIAVLLSFVVRVISPGGVVGSDVDEPFIRMTIPFAPSIGIATGLCLVFGPFSLF